MTQKTKTTTKRTTTKAKASTVKAQAVATKKTPVKKTAMKSAAAAKKKTVVAPAVATAAPCPTTFDDVRNAILVVSLLFNLFILIAWVILQVTTQYDAEVARFLFVR